MGIYKLQVEHTFKKRWKALKKRCHDPSTKDWHRYGGRGITLCEEWQHDWRPMLEHMGYPPTLHHVMDRIDNDRGYEPGNMRWVDRQTSALNRKRTWKWGDGKT